MDKFDHRHDAMPYTTFNPNLNKMDKPIYVKIKAGIEMQRWYAKLVGATFPIVSEDETYYGLADGNYIRKEDCEVVPTLQQENKEPISAYKLEQIHQEPDILKVSHASAEKFEKSATYGAGNYWNFKKCFYEGFDLGYRTAEERTQKPVKSEVGVVPEGQHLISTEQLKELHKLGDFEIEAKLDQWFPTVFVPAKTQTYKVGDRIKHPKTRPVYTIIEGPYGTIALYIEDRFTVCNNGKFVKVKDIKAITKEELTGLCHNVEEFTLLPDSTDQMV